jgi:DNA-binding PadR family transcriptional regulator
MGISNVYGTLKQLERAGHVECVLDDESYPPRKVYTITPDGRRSFLAWTREPVPAIRDMRVEFLAKLYFFHTLRLDGVSALLEAQRQACRERLEQLDQGAAGAGDSFERIVREFRRRRIEASLDWLGMVEREWA